MVARAGGGVNELGNENGTFAIVGILWMYRFGPQAKAMADHQLNGVQEKDVPAVLIAGVRMRGPYSDCGKGFAQIGRKIGRYISGKPMLLHYDDEYREDDADFEACMPVRAAKNPPPDGNLSP